MGGWVAGCPPPPAVHQGLTWITRVFLEPSLPLSVPGAYTSHGYHLVALSLSVHFSLCLLSWQRLCLLACTVDTKHVCIAGNHYI